MTRCDSCGNLLRPGEGELRCETCEMVGQLKALRARWEDRVGGGRRVEELNMEIRRLETGT